MGWFNQHRTSEKFVSEAAVLRDSGREDEAREKYRIASEYEEKAFFEIPPEQSRALGIIGESLIALVVKSGDHERAERLADEVLKHDIPNHSQIAIRDLIKLQF